MILYSLIRKQEEYMQIWLDTINLEVVAHASKANLIAGVTTNPSILSQTKHVGATLSKLLEIQPGPVAIQVTAQQASEMIKEGRQIAQFSDRAIVKVPVNYEGLITIRALKKENIAVLGTAIVHPNQALLAANAGVAYLSPYLSHIGELSNANQTLANIADLLRIYRSSPKLLVASLKSVDDLVYCALLGVDGVTIKEDLYEKLIANHYLMEKFSQKFAFDWKQAHGTASIGDFLTSTRSKLPEKLLCFSLAETFQKQ